MQFHHFINDPLPALNLYFLLPDRDQQIGVGGLFFFFGIGRGRGEGSSIVSKSFLNRSSNEEDPHQTFDRPTSSNVASTLCCRLKSFLGDNIGKATHKIEKTSFAMSSDPPPDLGPNTKVRIVGRSTFNGQRGTVQSSTPKGYRIKFENGKIQAIKREWVVPIEDNDQDVPNTTNPTAPSSKDAPKEAPKEATKEAPNEATKAPKTSKSKSTAKVSKANTSK